MPLLKKITKAVGKAAKRGGKLAGKLAGKVAKKTTPYGVGRIAGSLARGKAPRTSDVLSMFGVRPMKKTKKIRRGRR